MKNVRSTKHDSNVWHHWTPNSIPDSGHFWNQNIDVWTWITVFSLAVIKNPTAPWDSAHQEVLSGVIKTELNFSLHRHFKPPPSIKPSSSLLYNKSTPPLLLSIVTCMNLTLGLILYTNKTSNNLRLVRCVRHCVNKKKLSWAKLQYCKHA